MLNDIVDQLQSLVHITVKLLRIVCIGYTKFPFLRHSIRKSTQSLQSLIVNEGPHCSPSYSHMFECADFTPG